MPSLTPAATQRLWSTLVRRRQQGRPLAASADCRPLRAVFYAQNDWLRLATTLAADASPCAQYYISVPPLAADKTQLRTDQASKIRALGPSFHALAEVQYAGWSGWVAANHATWYQAGVEARRRMAAAGFDVAAGDTWAVNELSSGVRRGDPGARQDLLDFVAGLYAGDGTTPPTKGVVFAIGFGQTGSDPGIYKTSLEGWYLDSAFWQQLGTYVSDFSQEVYGDVRAEAVPAAPLAQRIEALNQYLGHPLALAQVAPPVAAPALSFLQQAYSPLANAAWIWDSGYGFTDVPVAQMEDYVSVEVAALRTLDAAAGLPADHFGFAWAPRMPDGSAWTPQFTSESGAVLQRLAAAIHDSAESPDAACPAPWCTAGLPGAAFTDSWSTFATWTAQLAFATPPVSVTAGSPSAAMTVELQADGITYPAGAPVDVTLSSSSAGGTFSTSPTGPWTPTLALTIAAGNTGASFYYSDTDAGTPTITAAAAGAVSATQVEGVGGAAPPPPPATPDLRVALTSPSTVAPPPGGTLEYLATVTTANAGSSSSASLQLVLPAGYAVTGTSGAAGGCTPSGQTLACELGPIAPGTTVQVAVSGTVSAFVAQQATATVTSLSPPETNPTDNTATLLLRPVLPRALRAPRIVGRPRLGGRVHVLPPRWTDRPVRVAYLWKLCTAYRCMPLGGATGQGLVLRPAFAGKHVRVVATATFPGVRVRTVSARVPVPRARP